MDNNNNGYNPYNNGNYYQPPYKTPSSALENAAMILSVMAAAATLTFTVYPSLILGVLAIIMAILSKGTKSELVSKAKRGILFGSIAIIVNIVILVTSVTLVFTNSEMRSILNQQTESIYGITFDEMIEQLDGGTDL